MSKQSIAKQSQNYNPQPCSKTCGNCVYFESEIVPIVGWGATCSKEVGKRCGLGGFAVKKTATCDRFEVKNVQ